MRESSTQFDIDLNQVTHFKQYPLMRPYVGNNYSSKKNKILLIAESFYLPNECKLNKESQRWYEGNESMLSDYEKPWINCRGLIECEWESAGHFIYRELNRVLQEVSGEGFSSVSFMNAFQRPACEEGHSFKDDCEEVDEQYAVETINVVQNILKPDVVIFVAKYPWDRLGSRVKKEGVANQYSFVCHPCTGGRYWHKQSYPHGRSKFVEILKNTCDPLLSSSE